LSCFAVDATALPAFFMFGDLDVLRLADAVECGLPRYRLPFELRPDVLFVC
jgi:hypothetical protein